MVTKPEWHKAAEAAAAPAVETPAAADTPAAPASPPPPPDPPVNIRKKTGSTRFKKGTSPNPAGRPKGSRNRATVWIDSLTDDDHVAIQAKLTRLAKRGDRAVLKMYADRNNPVRKARVAFQLRPIASAADVVAAMADVAAAVAAGVLTLDEAASASIIIEKTRDAISLVGMEAQLREIEKQVFKT
jgi:hypothetical protein